MTELKCNVIHCASNRDNCCCRPEIQVDGKHAQDCCETCCASFTKIQDGATNTMDYSRPNQTMPIRCAAENCKYNEQGKCDAKAICMGGTEARCQSQTECTTFCCK